MMTGGGDLSKSNLRAADTGPLPEVSEFTF